MMEEKVIGSQLVKRGMAQMQKGGVIMDVINAEQAKIAEAAGAVAGIRKSSIRYSCSRWSSSNGRSNYC